jgi:hypothetical protein
MENTMRIMDHITHRYFASPSAFLPPFAALSAPIRALTHLKGA